MSGRKSSPPNRAKKRTRISAQKHFLSVKRTRRSRTCDAIRRRSSALIDHTDERYYTPRGPFLYDVPGVDDGSARARSIAYRGKYTIPRRPDDYMNETLKTIFTKGKQIGAGKQATVWLYDRTVWKIFQVPFSASAVKSNIKFLQKNKDSGVVPKIKYHNADWGYIKMLHLSNYQPLGRDVVNRSVAYRVLLLKALALARSKLPKNVQYGDLKNPDNIAVRHTKNGMVAQAKFYEGGTATKYSGKNRARVYVIEMAKDLRITREPFVRDVKAGKVTWLN